MTYLHLDLLLTDKEAIITNTHFDKEILRERLINRKNFWVQKLQTLLIHELITFWAPLWGQNIIWVFSNPMVSTF